jgi:glycosyltransferase involved in cell wall biosynthesis
VNILCVDQFGECGGAQRCLADLLPALTRREWRAHIAAPGGGFLAGIRGSGIPTYVLTPHSYANGRKSCVDMAKYAHDLAKLICILRHIIGDNSIELLYVNGPRFLPAAAIAAWLCSIPLIFHCHNRVVQPAAQLALRIALRISRAKMIGCCKYVTEPFERDLGPDRLSIVYNGVAASPFLRAKEFRIRRRIGVIGRIEEEKGQLQFVLAARLVVKRCPECRFIVIGAPLFSGSSYLEKVVQASHGLPIEFLGWRDDVPKLLAGLDLLVVPSTSIDATTRVIVEAFAAGVPVVAFPSGGIPEVLLDEETGFLASNHTPEALADRIVSILQMPAERLRFVVDLARKRWRENYTLDAYRQRVIGVISEAVERNVSHRSPCKRVGNNVNA